MLGFLFEEDDMKTADAACGGDKGPEPPPRGRIQCGLAGINNQGATCYLNSLIQTLVYTPEFRGDYPLHFIQCLLRKNRCSFC